MQNDRRRCEAVQHLMPYQRLSCGTSTVRNWSGEVRLLQWRAACERLAWCSRGASMSEAVLQDARCGAPWLMSEVAACPCRLRCKVGGERWYKWTCHGVVLWMGACCSNA